MNKDKIMTNCRINRIKSEFYLNEFYSLRDWDPKSTKENILKQSKNISRDQENNSYCTEKQPKIYFCLQELRSLIENNKIEEAIKLTKDCLRDAVRFFNNKTNKLDLRYELDILYYNNKISYTIYFNQLGIYSSLNSSESEYKLKSNYGINNETVYTKIRTRSENKLCRYTKTLQ